MYILVRGDYEAAARRIIPEIRAAAKSI